MVPLTEEAKAARLEDNAVYKQTLAIIQGIIPELEALYQFKSEKVKNKQA